MRRSWTTAACAAAMLGSLACGDAAKTPASPIVVADRPPSPSPSPSPATSDTASASDWGPIIDAALGGDAGAAFRRPADPPATSRVTLREGAVTVTGKLPREIIQAIVRRSFSRYRVCYEDALRANGALSGSVAVSFTIGRAGDVTRAADGGSDLPDAKVVSCVVSGFAKMSFPQPESGEVTVDYAIVFSPPANP